MSDIEDLARPSDWTPTLEAILGLAAYPHMTATRIVQILDRTIGPSSFATAKNRRNQALAEQLHWPRYANSTPMYRPAPVNGYNSLVPSHINLEAVVPFVIDRIRPDTEAIVELGCGYGKHLFAIRDLIEHVRPALKYFGGELSETGLRAARCLASLEPDRSPIHLHAFNHLDPSFEFLDVTENVIFFTHHSIEQVHLINESFFTAILDTCENFICVHEEPVGWQFNPDIMAKVRDGTLKLAAPMTKLFAPVDDVYAACTPFVLGWNINLVEVLQDLERQGLVRIESPQVNCSGNHIYNPTTRIVWTRA